jgi:arylformamidase
MVEMGGPSVFAGGGSGVAPRDGERGARRRRSLNTSRRGRSSREGVWMEIIDISVQIRTGMVVYEGDPPVRVERVAEIAAGDLANVSRLEMGAHTGTHVDAPAHFLDGAPGADGLPLDALIGDVVVVDAGAVEGELDADAIAALGIPAGSERVLFRTRNSGLWDSDRFEPGYVGLTGDGARALVDAGVRLVGIDYMSVAAPSDPVPAHLALLRAGVVILEGLDLRAAPPGPYRLVCLPLRIEGADGAPARAVLIRR